MINTRYGLFETNSSSVHSVVILSKSQYEKWKRSLGTENELAIYMNDSVVKPDNVEFVKINDYYDLEEMKNKMEKIQSEMLEDDYLCYGKFYDCILMDDCAIVVPLSY